MRHRALALIALGIAAPAAGESISITGRFPAPYREGGYIRRISVDRITGADGRALAFSLERALGSAGREVVLGGAPSEAGISGDVATEINERRVEQQRERCTQQEGDRCLKREQVKLICNARVVDMIADLRIAEEARGDVLYSARKTRHNESIFCPGDANRPGPVEGLVRGMVDDVAGEVARDITPYTRTYSQRFYESRDGMPKELGQRFKEAIAQTKRDMPGACAALAALDQELPHFALAYDAGLCAEAEGDYPRALAAYQRARDLRPRDA
ncbi:MAG: hypothetical protein K2X76_06825, partial [Sphingomonas sp.]|nr:hypothetical protein [Sphingomonas sp.]